MVSTGSLGPLTLGGRMKKKTKGKPPEKGGEKARVKTKSMKPKGGQRTRGDRYGLTI